MQTVINTLKNSFSSYSSKPAVRIYDAIWSYADLDRMSDVIADFLLAGGMRKNDRVVVSMRKSIYFYAAIIGILKSGGVYVPTDIKMPPLRLSKILRDVSPFAIFVDHYSCNVFKNSLGTFQHSINVAYLDEGLNEDFSKIDFKVNPKRFFSDLISVVPSDMALMLFTSGSTGMPKGVMITHGNLYNILQWTIGAFEYKSDDVGSAFNANAFDMSIEETLLILCSGGMLGVYPEEVIFPHDILSLTYDYGITRMFIVPSSLTALVKSGFIQPERLRNLKDVMMGGESIPTSTLQEIMNMLPLTKFHNLYGPSETTFYVSKFTYHEPPRDNDRITPIGFPIAGHKFTLDRTDFQEENNKGELIITGPQVGMGYWNDFEKTKKLFGINPQGERTYRTGDIVSLDPDLGYFIHGRTDNQIKYMGYRIEIGEIEHIVSSLPFVNGNAIIPIYINGKVEELKLVYAASKDYKNEILMNLKANLPSYMIPKYYIRTDKLPQNASNKIDRVKLQNEYGKNSYIGGSLQKK